MNSDERQSSRSLCVLIVDDERDTVDSLAFLLELWGHRAKKAYDGKQALQVLQTEWPDVVIIDIIMPTMDGFVLAKHIRELSNLKAPSPCLLPQAGEAEANSAGLSPLGGEGRVRGKPWLIALSGYVTEAFRQRCIEEGFDQHFLKPPDLELLRQALERI
jgi:CheY-like chemotaxis protein